jgi:hypothetical protein
MIVRKALTYCELDLKRCSLTYGVAPCTATIDGSPQTGTRKCYNSPKTCQDTANFSATTLTLRFGLATDYLPIEISCIPSIKSISTKPQVLNPGESLGERESVTVTFEDHPYNDVGIDKYHAERGFDPYQRGTFWSKFVARWPYIQGSAFRVIRGFEGDDLEDMESRHYIVDGVSGPDSNGNFSITAKDTIKLLDGDKAQAPEASTGVLLSAIDDNDTTITLSPAGIGNLEYPASGYASIGDEQVSFTRSGDTITLTGRGLESSEASSHEAGETFQLGIFYDGEDAADIIYDLITNYTEASASLITLTDWQTETGTYIDRQYSAKILKPTSVRDLINELISQVGLVIFSDTVNQKIKLYALRQFLPLAEIDDNIIIQDSLDIDEQPDKRVSLVLTYIGRKNPLKELDEESNYRIIVGETVSDSVAAIENRVPSIRKIYSRWISVFNRTAAESLNEIIIRRYQNAPRRFRFQLPITETPVLASAITLSQRNIQDDEGSPISTVAQIISIEKSEARYTIVAEEMTFVQEASTDHLIVIDQSTSNLNLRTVHDQIYADAVSGDNVVVIINSGVIVGSGSTSNPAFDIGSWASGVNITITNNGRIQGRGGGGAGNSGPQNGGVAFYTRYPVTIDNANGQIWGGGGGGGLGFAPPSTNVYGGGGGAGYPPGAGGVANSGGGNPGTTEEGGSGSSGIGGDGGDPGQAGGDGQAGPGSNAGAPAGAAIDGDSYVTFDSDISPADDGDIRGTRAN